MTARFDEYAEDYEAALNRGLHVSGEGRDFFLRGRVAWLKGRLNRLGVGATSILDFGCGTGTSVLQLRSVLGSTDIIGVDVSPKEIDVARRSVPEGRFSETRGLTPSADRDLVYTNGVFHHIPLAERNGAIRYIFECLRPGGLLAFWENNPWNPGTRFVMSKIPFDRDAITLSAPEARRLVREGGFEVMSTDFLFVFPAPLRRLRALEPLLSRLPVGAQYMILARRPTAS